MLCLLDGRRLIRKLEEKPDLVIRHVNTTHLRFTVTAVPESSVPHHKSRPIGRSVGQTKLFATRIPLRRSRQSWQSVIFVPQRSRC